MKRERWFPDGLYCNRCAAPAKILIPWFGPDTILRTMNRKRPPARPPQVLASVCSDCIEELYEIEKRRASKIPRTIEESRKGQGAK